MRKTLFISTAAIVLTMFAFLQASWAAKAYTTDTQEIPLRSAAGSQNRVLAMLPKGSAVEVVKTNDWVQVKYTGTDGQVKNGWVQSKFLESRPSESAVMKDLKGENQSLKEQLLEAEQARAGIVQKERDVADKLAKVEASYEELKGGSANYLKLKGEYDAAKTALRTAQEGFQSLMQENQGLKSTQYLYSFALGALVFFFGLLFGLFSRRKQKKVPTYRL